MANGTDPNSAIAVLIDADNANPSIVEGLLAEVAKFGSASVKRIYGLRVLNPTYPTIPIYYWKECD